MTKTRDLADLGGGFIQAGTGAVQRTVESKLQDTVSVKDFGAVGNGATNDKAAIIAADTYAASANKTLFFPAGTYLANDLTINCDWLGEEGSVILNDGTSTTYNFVRILSQSNVTVERLTFDGAVSADPPSWNSSNYNSFTGAVALHIFNSSSITVRNCTIRNSVLSPLRIDTCSSVLIDGCTVTKGRGNFGDCIYIRASNSSSIVNTVVSDATRACIVTEAGSHSWLFSNVRVSNAHDAGINYGGTEYNSGFWFENSANHVVVGCKATATRTGFLISTGTVAGVQSDQAHFQLNGCVANSNVTGYNFQSKAGQLPIDAKLIDCQSWNSDRGFHFEAKQTFDTFTCVGCHAEIAFTAGVFDCGYVYDSATITYPATFTFTDCTTSYKNYDQADLNSTSSNSADFSTATAGKSNITIRNCRNLSSEYPVVIKGRVGDLGLDVSKSYIDIRTFANADLRLTVEECEVAYASISGSGTTSISNSLITGSATIGVTGEIRLTDCSVKPGVSTLSVIRTLNDKKPALEIRGCRFEKDIATSDYILRIQEEGTNKPIAVISDCTFFNSGAATSTNSFIWVVRANTPISYFDNISDNNVTNLLKINTSLTNPASGDTKLLMH